MFRAVDPYAWRVSHTAARLSPLLRATDLSTSHLFDFAELFVRLSEWHRRAQLAARLEHRMRGARGPPTMRSNSMPPGEESRNVDRAERRRRREAARKRMEARHSQQTAQEQAYPALDPTVEAALHDSHGRLQEEQTNRRQNSSQDGNFFCFVNFYSCLGPDQPGLPQHRRSV